MQDKYKLIELLNYLNEIYVNENAPLAIDVLKELDSKFMLSVNDSTDSITLKTVKENSEYFEVVIDTERVEIEYQKNGKLYVYDYSKRNILAKIIQIYNFYI